MTPIHAYIAGTGAYVPPRIVTNQDLIDAGIDTTDAWIRSRTGIEARRFAADGEGPSDMAVPAVRDAVESAGLQIEDIDFIIFATLSPEHAFPGSGCYLQAKLGLPGIPALDVRNQCSGFLYALGCARGLVSSGMARNVVVVGAEKHSAAMDFSTEGRAISCLFGDGAGAVVVRGSEDPRRGIRSLRLGADGRFADALAQKVWDTRNSPFIPTDADGRGIVEKDMLWARMDGKRVFRSAVETMIGSVVSTCRENEIEVAELDLLVCHQANLRINEYVRDQLGMPPEKVPSNIEKYANTTAATIPILLAELERDGRLKPGMNVALVAFGSGFTWGCAFAVW
ncbi:MAG: ketoacyl-ACP synthase III [Deltaproteobacteria bacterium]|nr:ketoacyl-ACP synthase III [Deltaproteobacteria bacterium]